MKFSVGTQTLGTLLNKTTTQSDDLKTLIQKFIGSIDGQNQSFIQGAQQGADAHAQSEGSVDYAGVEAVGRFGPR